MVCLTYFGPVSQLFFHFGAVFWFYGNRVINLKSEPLDRLLCECTTVMIWAGSEFSPFFQSSIDSKWDTGS